MAKRNLGSDFDAFLEEEGLLAASEAEAVKRVIAFQISGVMKAEGISKTEMARRMSTSRSALNRLLDPANGSVTLHTLECAARALGKRLRVRLSS